MSNFASVAPTFLVDDVAGTAAWYEKHLGFAAGFVPKQAPYVFASLQRDGVEIMLLRQHGYTRPCVDRQSGSWDAYIRMKGVEEFYGEVRRKISLKSELVQRPYGDWEFEVADPNGYVLVFSELK